MRNAIPVLPPALLVCAAAVLLSGCNKPAGRANAGAPTVTVANPVVREVTDYAYFTGRIDAYETVDIQAMVGGYIDKVDFLDGSPVRKGDVLFEIDPRTYQAEYNQAMAQKRVADAELNLAETQFARVVQSGTAATQEEKDQKEAAVKVSIANRDKASADVQRKLLDLNFTKVLAPRDGVMGKALLKKGNLVKGGTSGGDRLATLVSQNPIYVYFDVDAATHYNVAKLINEGSLHYKYGDTLENLALAASVSGLLSTPTTPGGALTAAISVPPGKRFSFYPLWVGIPSEKVKDPATNEEVNTFPYRGYIDFINNQVDASTGTLRLRGILPNYGGKFKPGDFVRVKVPTNPPHTALLINEKAIGNTLDEKFVFVINAENKAVSKSVILGGQHGNLREIVVPKDANDPKNKDKYLNKDDRVVIIGLQRVRRNAEVKVIVGKMDDRPDPEQGVK